MALTVFPDLRLYIDIEIDSIEWAQFRGLLASPERPCFQNIMLLWPKENKGHCPVYVSA